MDKWWFRSQEGIAQMSNYCRDYFGSCFSTLWMRGRTCLFWCLQLILFSFAPISGSFVALVLVASLQLSLFLVFVVIVDGFWFRFVNVRPVFSLFWIVCYLYQWSSYLQPSKLLLWGRSPEGIAQRSNYRRDYFGSCFSTLWMRGQSCSCLFWCLQLILFSFAPIYGSFVALVFGGVSPVQLVFSVCCDCRWILVSICECAASL